MTKEIIRETAATSVDLTERSIEMTKTERSCLLYLETCAVDQGGLVEAIRMNADDHTAVASFVADGLLWFGRIPGRLLNEGPKKTWTHWVEFNATGWLLASQCRQLRGLQRGPYGEQVFEVVHERRKPLAEAWRSN